MIFLCTKTIGFIPLISAIDQPKVALCFLNTFNSLSTSSLVSKEEIITRDVRMHIEDDLEVTSIQIYYFRYLCCHLIALTTEYLHSVMDYLHLGRIQEPVCNQLSLCFRVLSRRVNVILWTSLLLSFTLNVSCPLCTLIRVLPVAKMAFIESVESLDLLPYPKPWNHLEI